MSVGAVSRDDGPAGGAAGVADGPHAEVPGSAAWWAAREARDARRRPRQDGLSIERIIDAAIRLVDEHGLPALTVRRLADELGTGSASLYRHVASREELLVLMVDHVIGEVDLPGEQVPGRQRVEQLAHELRRVLLDHAQLLPALTAAPLLGPNAVGGAGVGLSSMLAAGYGPEQAVPAVLALIDFVLGTVYFDTSSAGRSLAAGQEQSSLAAGQEQSSHAAGQEQRSHAAGQEQRSLAAGGSVGVPVADEVFAFGLETFLAGLEHRFGS